MKQDTKNPTKQESGSHEEASKKTANVPATRRSVLLTMTAGTVTASLTATPVVADQSIDLDIVDDGETYGGNPTGVPETLEVDPASTITVKTGDISDGSLVTVTIGAEPQNGNADFHEIGEGAFQVGGDYEEEDGEHKFPLGDIPDGGRDLFDNPDIDPSTDTGEEFWTPSGLDDVHDVDLEELEDEDNRYVSRTIEIQLKATVHGEDEPFAVGTAEFDVYFARTGGLGSNLGYSLGSKWPVDNPDFEGNV